MRSVTYSFIVWLWKNVQTRWQLEIRRGSDGRAEKKGGFRSSPGPGENSHSGFIIRSRTSRSSGPKMTTYRHRMLTPAFDWAITVIFKANFSTPIRTDRKHRYHQCRHRRGGGRHAAPWSRKRRALRQRRSDVADWCTAICRSPFTWSLGRKIKKHVHCSNSPQDFIVRISNRLIIASLLSFYVLSMLADAPRVVLSAHSPRDRSRANRVSDFIPLGHYDLAWPSGVMVD